MNSEKSGKRALLASIFTLLLFEPLLKNIYAYDMMTLSVATKGDLIYIKENINRYDVLKW